MNSDVEKLLARAEECLAESTQLFDTLHYLGAINRAYYCIFDCARALLLTHGLYTKTHQGLQSRFSELFIKTGVFETKYGETMRHVFNLRQISDYDLDADLTEDDARYALEGARAFLAQSQHHLIS